MGRPPVLFFLPWGDWHNIGGAARATEGSSILNEWRAISLTLWDGCSFGTRQWFYRLGFGLSGGYCLPLSGQTETQQRYAKQESGKIFHNKRKDERLNILTMTKTSIQKPTTR